MLLEGGNAMAKAAVGSFGQASMSGCHPVCRTGLTGLSLIQFKQNLAQPPAGIIQDDCPSELRG